MSEPLRTIHSKTGLRQMMKEYRTTHPPQVELCFLLQDWEDAYNVGGMFRVAEACGAQELVMTGRTPVPPDPQVHVTSMGQHRRVPWRRVDRHEEAADGLIAAGWTLVAIELSEGSVSYREFEFPPRTCLVLGNEVNGVYGSLIQRCEAAVFVPMYGKGRSLNVHVAAAIVGFAAVVG